MYVQECTSDVYVSRSMCFQHGAEKDQQAWWALLKETLALSTHTRLSSICFLMSSFLPLSRENHSCIIDSSSSLLPTHTHNHMHTNKISEVIIQNNTTAPEGVSILEKNQLHVHVQMYEYGYESHLRRHFFRMPWTC